MFDTMKKLFVLFFALFAGFVSAKAQDTEYANMPVILAYEGDTDCTARYKDEQAYITLYKNEAGEFCMAHVCPKSNVKSFGVVKFDEVDTYDETDSKYATMEYTFDWHFTNSVDGESGVARCLLAKVYKPAEVVYVVTYNLPDGSNRLFQVGLSGDVDEFFDDIAEETLNGLLGTWIATTLDVYDDGGELMKSISVEKENAELKVTFNEDATGVIHTLNNEEYKTEDFTYYYDWPYIAVQRKAGADLIFKFEDGKLSFKELDGLEVVMNFEKQQ